MNGQGNQTSWIGPKTSSFHPSLRVGAQFVKWPVAQGVKVIGEALVSLFRESVAGSDYARENQSFAVPQVVCGTEASFLISATPSLPHKNCPSVCPGTASPHHDPRYQGTEPTASSVVGCVSSAPLPLELLPATSTLDHLHSLLELRARKGAVKGPGMHLASARDTRRTWRSSSCKLSASMSLGVP